MQLKILSKWQLFIAGTVLTGFSLALGLFGYVLLKGGSFSVDAGSAVILSAQQPALVSERPSYGLPMRLKIPKINVDSAVEYVGLASDGTMDVPKERDKTAWFNLGSRPGENGSAVISGHYGRQNNEGSVFDDLHKLRKGDKIYTEDENGKIISFVVRESRRYDPETKSTDNADIFGSIDGKPHLNLITCEGVWDENTQQYTKRLVVFADIETDEN